MATQTNSSSSGFHRELLASPSSSIKFQSGAINCVLPEMVPIGLGSGSNNSDLSGTLNSAWFGCNSSSGTAQLGSGFASNSESVPGLKYGTGIAVEWSAEEQFTLEQGLEKYSSEPNIMKYVKIAANLPDKTVRDVALRCRWWMMRKRRKPEEQNAGMKLNNRKDKLVQTSWTVPLSMAASTMKLTGQNEHMLFSGLSSTANNLLEQNAQDFSRITANLSTFKLQENIDLFCRTRDNITAILNDMNETPGIMSQMPPLPVSIDDNLIHSILPNRIQYIHVYLQNATLKILVAA